MNNINDTMNTSDWFTPHIKNPILSFTKPLFQYYDVMSLVFIDSELYQEIPDEGEELESPSEDKAEAGW